MEEYYTSASERRLYHSEQRLASGPVLMGQVTDGHERPKRGLVSDRPFQRTAKSKAMLSFPQSTTKFLFWIVGLRLAES